MANDENYRILLLVPFTPRLDTPHGGGRVLAQFISAISHRHRIALLILGAPDELPIDNAIKERCEIVEEIHRPWADHDLFSRVKRISRLAHSLLSKKPMWAADWESKVFAERVYSIATTWKPDIVQAIYGVMGQYFPAIKDINARRILTEYEPGILASPYLKAGPSFLQRFAYQRDKKSWLKYEPALMKQSDAVIVLTARDKGALEFFGLSNPIYIIPFGTEIPRQPLDPLGSEALNILFTGSFIHPPNIEAALRLVSDIYPKVREKFPELKLYIVGDQPPQELKRKSDNNIIVTGWVPEVLPYLNEASVFVAPLKSGGGMRVKLLEALAAGKAVVTTKLGVEGLDIMDHEQVYIAESDQEISEAIAELLSKPGEREKLARRARDWACEHISWESSIQKYEQVYRQLLTRN